MFTLSITDICVMFLTAIIILGFVHLGFFFVRKWAINKVETKIRAELNKLADISTSRAVTVNKELTNLDIWMNTGFPSELAHSVLTDSTLMKFRNKARISEAMYVESLEPLISHIQEIVTIQTSAFREKVNAELAEDLKGLINDKKDTKSNKE
jgi:hypothetical protein